MGKLGKKELDLLGEKLLRLSRLEPPEADRIAERSHLFASVLKKAEAFQRVPDDRPKRVFLLDLTVFKGAASAAVFMIAAVASVSVYLVKDRAAEVSEDRPSMPAEKPVGSLSNNPPGSVIMYDLLPADSEPERSIRPARTLVKTQAAPRRQAVRPQTLDMRESAVEEFYPITFAGDPYETARGGRVVRVDVPATTLFAMGLRHSLENASEMVKADLLIGPDGVARGIRLVR
ncbi:hypothetical protein [Leptolyngbya sp. 7M]|uniref:hypothetical protein n=1 Tax=Leptolyngbya sp. 7M TaxID=2812896 RepID=UPI001B8B899C|nr:hypothetical protein [Leptolyngbya sp. 7M]QYO66314.1 hypothetical protein JVX88_05805 [Leptolyngbya sp. 7M]